MKNKKYLIILIPIFCILLFIASYIYFVNRNSSNEVNSNTQNEVTNINENNNSVNNNSNIVNNNQNSNNTNNTNSENNEKNMFVDDTEAGKEDFFKNTLISEGYYKIDEYLTLRNWDVPKSFTWLEDIRSILQKIEFEKKLKLETLNLIEVYHLSNNTLGYIFSYDTDNVIVFAEPQYINENIELVYSIFYDENVNELKDAANLIESFSNDSTEMELLKAGEIGDVNNKLSFSPINQVISFNTELLEANSLLNRLDWVTALESYIESNRIDKSSVNQVEIYYNENNDQIAVKLYTDSIYTVVLYYKDIYTSNNYISINYIDIENLNDISDYKLIYQTSDKNNINSIVFYDKLLSQTINELIGE